MCERSIELTQTYCVASPRHALILNILNLDRYLHELLSNQRIHLNNRVDKPPWTVHSSISMLITIRSTTFTCKVTPAEAYLQNSAGATSSSGPTQSRAEGDVMVDATSDCQELEIRSGNWESILHPLVSR